MNRWVFSDRAVLVFCILLALVLWIQVTGSQNQDIQRTFTQVPVTWQDLPEDLSLVAVLPSQVDVTLRASRDIMQELSADDFIASVSLTGAEEGTLDHFVTVSVPRGVQLVQVTPQVIRVTLEPTVDQLFPISVVVEGEPEVPLAEPTTDPSRVMVNGPASRVQQVDRVQVTTDVTGLLQDRRETVVVIAVDAAGQAVRGVLVTPRQIDVLVFVESSQVTREVRVKPVLIGDVPEGFTVARVRVEPQTVDVTGTESTVEGLDYLTTELIDLHELDIEWDGWPEPNEDEETDEEPTETPRVEVRVPVGVATPNIPEIRVEPSQVIVWIEFWPYRD